MVYQISLILFVRVDLFSQCLNGSVWIDMPTISKFCRARNRNVSICIIKLEDEVFEWALANKLRYLVRNGTFHLYTIFGPESLNRCKVFSCSGTAFFLRGAKAVIQLPCNQYQQGKAFRCIKCLKWLVVRLNQGFVSGKITIPAFNLAHFTSPVNRKQGICCKA